MQDIVQAKIPSKDAQNPLAVKRNEAKAVFDALLAQKKDLLNKKKALMDQIKDLQSALKRKTDEAKNSKDKLGYKTTAEIDQQISSYEHQLQVGGLALIDEKRIVADITTLKKTRKTLESLSNPTGEGEKNKLDELRPQLKVLDGKINEFDKALNDAKATLVASGNELSSSRESLTDLFTEKKTLSAELTALKEQKSQLYKNFKATQDAWYAYEREQYKLREEARKLEQKAYREAKLLAQAEAELEAANQAAFGEEIALCNAIIKVLYGLSGEKQVKEEAPAAAVSAGRKVDPNDSLPKGATVLVSKRDKEDDYLVLGGKNKKKNKKHHSEAAKPLKLDLEMVDQFGRLQVSLPGTAADIPSVLAELEAKKAHYLENQAKQTEINRAAALEKVEKLKATLDQEETEQE